MSGTGNTTVPTGPDDPSAPAPYTRLVPALFLAWSAHQPDRIGEVALFDPNEAIHFIIGREVEGGPARVHFFQLRPGESIDGGPLTGANISQQQLRITVEASALSVKNIGTAVVRVDGTVLARDHAVLVRPCSVIEVHGNCVLLVGVSPLSLPHANHRLLPLHAFGEADRMGMVGESRSMWELREDTLFAASAGRNVFVHGDTGTGKELVARAIHDLSPRSEGPYITANSSSLTPELVASELFGNPRGYPNPGTPERDGYFGQAQGGTLLLDEIGEVLDTVQAPLLRALEGAYNRVGEAKSRPTACIVILATNREQSRVKHDVLHRLGVTVQTPALADRREDIPLLARALLLKRGDDNPAFEKAFVRRDARGWRHVPVDAALIVGIVRSRLPGNIRELDNLLTESIKGSGGEPPLRWPRRLTMPPPTPLDAPPEPEEPSVEELVAGIGREAPDPSRARTREALVMHDWNIGRTAAYLEVSVRHLYRLREKYGLLDPEEPDEPK